MEKVKNVTQLIFLIVWPLFNLGSDAYLFIDGSSLALQIRPAQKKLCLL